MITNAESIYAKIEPSTAIFGCPHVSRRSALLGAPKAKFACVLIHESVYFGLINPNFWSSHLRPDGYINTVKFHTTIRVAQSLGFQNLQWEQERWTLRGFMSQSTKKRDFLY